MQQNVDSDDTGWFLSLVNERSENQKVTNYIILLVWHSGKGKAIVNYRAVVSGSWVFQEQVGYKEAVGGKIRSDRPVLYHYGIEENFMHLSNV